MLVRARVREFFLTKNLIENNFFWRGGGDVGDGGWSKWIVFSMNLNLKK